MENVGGMQRVALQLHDALTDIDREAESGLDYEAELLRTSWDRVHIRTPLFLLKAAARILRAAWRGEVDVVLFSSMVTASLAVPLQGFLRNRGVHTAAIVHGLDVTLPVAPYQWFVPKVFRALDAVLPVSRATGAACTDRGLDPSKCRVVPNGIDPGRFPTPTRPVSGAAGNGASGDGAVADGEIVPEPASPHAPATGVDSASSLPDDALLLCSVGRQVERKGFAWFVDRVMPRLPEDVHYWMAGDGPRSDAIQDAIDRHGLAGRVRRLGRISNDDLARLYRGADLFVMPNIPVAGDMEGFGIVLLEAGACGTPAIAARLEGIQDVISEDVNGHLVEPESPAAFEDAILRYRHAPDRLHERSRKAAEHTRSTFGWPAIARRYVDVLRTLVETGRPEG